MDNDLLTAGILCRECMRKSFVPLPVDAWSAIAAALNKPWPQAAARFDVIWHAGLGLTVGRRRFAARWGWSEGRARKLLTSMGRPPVVHDWRVYGPERDFPWVFGPVESA